MVITQVQFGSIYAAEHEPIETLEDAIIYQHNQREWIGKDQQWQEVYDTQLIGFLTVAPKRELCYTCANKEGCSSQECTCAQADIFSP